MPQIPVKIEEAEELDHKIASMCVDKQAILLADGGTFSNIFPKATNRIKVFRRKYAVALGTGLLLFTNTAEVSIHFDYIDMYGQIQMTRRAIEDTDDIFPEVRKYWYRMTVLGERVVKHA